MQCYDVALWLTPCSWWPDAVNGVHADAACLTVVQLMPMHDLQCVSQGTVMASDSTCHRWWHRERSEEEVKRENV